VRHLLNKQLGNKHVQSDFTRMLLLISRIEKFNEHLTRIGNEEETKMFKKKVYVLVPRGDKHADDRRRFVELTPQAACGFFWNFASTNKNLGYVDKDGVWIPLSFLRYWDAWRLYTDIFDRQHAAINLVQNR
jgi:hypothetical protein